MKYQPRPSLTFECVHSPVRVRVSVSDSVSVRTRVRASARVSIEASVRASGRVRVRVSVAPPLTFECVHSPVRVGVRVKIDR